MKYVQLRKNDYDKSLKLNNQLCLCYSAKKLKEIENDDVEIIGEVLKGETDKESESKLSVENKLIPVFDNGSFNKLLYKKTAYIAVEESDGYIAVMENRLPILIWLLGLLIVAVIAIMLLVKMPKADTNAYNALPPVDSNIEMLEEDGSTTTTMESTAPEGGGKVGIGYEEVAKLNLSTKEIEMEYTNPGISSHDATVELCIVSEGNEYLVAASGRIPAGSKLVKMKLSDKAPNLKQGVYNAKYKIYYYDAKTGEKALVSSDIEDIDLIVKNK